MSLAGLTVATATATAAQPSVVPTPPTFDIRIIGPQHVPAMGKSKTFDLKEVAEHKNGAPFIRGPSKAAAARELCALLD